MGHAHLLGDLVRRSKSNAADVLRQDVRIGAQCLDGLFSISFVDPHRPAGAYAIGMQKDHDLANDLLFGPGGFDAAPAFRTDALDFLKPSGAVFDDLKNLFTELRDEFAGVGRANPLDHAAGQVLFDALPCGWGCAAEQVGPKLKPKLPVLNPSPFGRKPFAGIDRRQRSNHCHRLAMASRFDLDDGEAILLVEETDPFNQAGEALGRR